MFDTFLSDPPTPFDAALAEHYDHRDAELALRAELEAARFAELFADAEVIEAFEAARLADLDLAAPAVSL